jgi:hypothetical protein
MMSRFVTHFVVRLPEPEAMIILKEQSARLPFPSGSGTPLAQSGCSFLYPMTHGFGVAGSASKQLVPATRARRTGLT